MDNMDLLCGTTDTSSDFFNPAGCFNLEDVDVCDIISTLPRQYRGSPNIGKMLGVFVDSINCIYADLRIISGISNCANLTGDQLTRYGELIGFPRCQCNIYCFDTGFHCIEDDDLYCTFLQAYIASKGETTIGNLERVLRILFGEDAFVIGSQHGRTQVSSGRPLTDQEIYYIALYKRFLPHSCATTVDIYDITIADLANIFGVNCGICDTFADACVGASPLCNAISCDDLLHPPEAPIAPFTDTGDVLSAINETHGTFTDIDGDTITLSSSGLPASVVFTDNGDGTYTLTGTYPASAGTTTYTVTADDGLGGTVVLSGNQIIATNALGAPNITCPANQLLGLSIPV